MGVTQSMSQCVTRRKSGESGGRGVDLGEWGGLLGNRGGTNGVGLIG